MSYTRPGGLRVLQQWSRACSISPLHRSGRSFSTEAALTLRNRLKDPKLLREQAFIAGTWTNGASTTQFPVLDPYSGSQIGTCPEMGVEDVNRAVEAAQTAFESFQFSTARQRMTILKKWFELMQEHEEDLATILTFENGRPLTAARAEIKYAASFFEWFQGEAVRSYGETIHSSTAGSRVLTLKQAVGVVGIITPWNFPSAMITRKVGASVAAGCTVVVKPAADTPYSALALAELAERAGLPAGVFNVVTTDKNVAAVGRAICEHPVVKKVSFTGSTGVGKILMQQSSSTLKKLSMELGGNAPFVVFNDADLEKAVDGLMAAKFRASGQTCVSANRIYVQSDVYDTFVKKITEAVEKRQVVGDPLAPEVTAGPLISAKAASKVEELVSDAVLKGAKIVTGGVTSQSHPPTHYPPTVLRDMSSGMRASREEIFGPVVALYKFETEKDLLTAANDSEVGLASYIYTSQLSRAWRVAELLQTGMVGVNTGVISDPVAAFGGIKQSGFGREGGRVGIEEFQIMKTITVAGLDLPEERIGN